MKNLKRLNIIKQKGNEKTLKGNYLTSLKRDQFLNSIIQGVTEKKKKKKKGGCIGHSHNPTKTTLATL